MTLLLWYSLIAGLFSLVGGLILLGTGVFYKKIITSLLSFAAGAFLGAAFLDILPEAIESVDEPHPIFIAALVGFVLFFALERGLMKYFHRPHHDSHDHEDHTESLPFLVILGDTFHNFLDGIVIALAYIANPALGLTAALAIAAHEIPQEIGDFSILLNQGWPKSRIIMVNILQSLMTVPGVLLGYYGGMAVEPQLPYLLGAAAGIFIYLAASDLIPEIHHHAGHKHFFRVLIPMVLSMVVVGYLVSLAHNS